MLTSTGVLAPKKRKQLTAARAVAADTNRRRGIDNRTTVRAKAAELKAQREKRGENPLSYPQLCNSIARVLRLSAKSVKTHYPKSLYT
jgi:hypothetical protein